MSMKRQVWYGVVLGSCGLLAGCLTSGPRMPATPGERPVVLKAAQQADMQIAMGRSLEKGASPEQAVGAYQEAIKKDPKRADAIDRLAVLHARKGQFEQAIALHKKALAVEPKNPDFLCNLGYCYYLQQRWLDAEAQFRKAIDLMPDHARALNNMGLVLAHTNRSELALVAFRRGGCSEADAHSNLAFVLTLENSWQQAKEHYAQARQLDPSSTTAAKGLQAVNTQLKPAETTVRTPASTEMPIRPVTVIHEKNIEEATVRTPAPTNVPIHPVTAINVKKPEAVPAEIHMKTSEEAVQAVHTLQPPVEPTAPLPEWSDTPVRPVRTPSPQQRDVSTSSDSNRPLNPVIIENGTLPPAELIQRTPAPDRARSSAYTPIPAQGTLGTVELVPATPSEMRPRDRSPNNR